MPSNFSHGEGPGGPGKKTDTVRAAVPRHALRIPQARAAVRPRSILSVGMVYVGRWRDCHESLMKRGLLVRSIALMALAAQQAAQP